jgi:hypothetical protein
VARPGIAHAEVEMGRGRRAGSGYADGADAVAGGNLGAGSDRERRQVEVGGVVTVATANADRQAGGSGAAREADLAPGRRDHGRSDGGCYVDASVLSSCIRIGAVAVARDDLARHRPYPGCFGGRRDDEEARDEKKKESAHAANVRAVARPSWSV